MEDVVGLCIDLVRRASVHKCPSNDLSEMKSSNMVVESHKMTRWTLVSDAVGCKHALRPGTVRIDSSFHPILKVSGRACHAGNALPTGSRSVLGFVSVVVYGVMTLRGFQ